MEFILDNPMRTIASFLFISFVVSFTTTALKHDDLKEIIKSGSYLFVLMVVGIACFSLVIQIICFLI